MERAFNFKRVHRLPFVYIHIVWCGCGRPITEGELRSACGRRTGAVPHPGRGIHSHRERVRLAGVANGL
jgi:hypothetical protein